MNAYKCYLYDQYAPQCENQVLAPKCLYALHMEIEAAKDRLWKLEKCFPDPGQEEHMPVGGRKSGTKLN